MNPNHSQLINEIPAGLNSECDFSQWIHVDKLCDDPTEEDPENQSKSDAISTPELSSGPSEERSNSSPLPLPEDRARAKARLNDAKKQDDELTILQPEFWFNGDQFPPYTHAFSAGEDSVANMTDDSRESAGNESSFSPSEASFYPADEIETQIGLDFRKVLSSDTSVTRRDEQDGRRRERGLNSKEPKSRTLSVRLKLGSPDDALQSPTQMSATQSPHLTQLAKLAAGSYLPPSQCLRSSPAPRPPKNSRGALSVMINLAEKGDLGYADSGSGKNIMSEAYALQKGLIIRKGQKNVRLFQLGNGKLIYSVGRVRTYVKLAKSCGRPKKEWFHVLANCPVPLILGMPFLKDAQVLTEKRHLLESCPPEFGTTESVFWIGTPQNRIKCNLDGRNVIAVADYGSDVNLMSLSYAKREGHHIDRRQEVRTRLQFGDGSQADTVGQVIVSNLTLDWRRPATTTLEEMYPDHSTAGAGQPGSSPSLNHQSAQHADATFSAAFDVLPSLPCDILLGRDFLWATDAFNICPALATSAGGEGCLYAEFKFTRSLGYIDKFRRWIRGDLEHSGSELEDEKMHDEARHEKAYKLWKIDVELVRLSGQSKVKKEDERKKIVKDWQNRHGSCRFCNSASVSS
ncbi:hypothetical protein DL771_007143 [Monosporascus sp. 5C6A]|nr:hypothetical protein DL771_007143 [Monosporascus sp. 5C6A]